MTAKLALVTAAAAVVVGAVVGYLIALAVELIDRALRGGGFR